VTERNTREALQCWLPLRPVAADIRSRPPDGPTALLFRDRRSC